MVEWMEQTFRTEDFKRALEKALGFEIAEFRKLRSINSLNFRTVRSSDGFTFLVKCSPAATHLLSVQKVLQHLEDLKGARIFTRLFEKECPQEFAGYRVYCVSWIEGEPLSPDELSVDEFHQFLFDYLEFSSFLQKATCAGGTYPLAKWRAHAEAIASGFVGSFVRRLLAEMPIEDSVHRPELIRILHGDLHPGNFCFKDHRVASFFDLDSFICGYLAEDLMRYFVFTYEHTGLFASGRRRTILRRLEQAVRELPWSRHEWILAANAQFLERIDKKLNDRESVSLKVAIQLIRRARFYRRLRAIINRVCDGKESPGAV